MKSLKILFFITLLSMALAGLWNQVPIIKNSVSAILDPTAGVLLDSNVNSGMLIIVAAIMVVIILVQKYTMDHELMAEIKKEQKLLNEEMKKYKDHPEKLMDLQKQSLKTIPKTLEVTMRPTMFTFIPIILFFRWFQDYFAEAAVKVFGIFSWFWAYLLLSIFFSVIFRKLFRLP
jgi:uncharacterized membrane protein (DUF106 family)